ncbi:MAG TPA: hypothetical protein VL485_11200 [Ktedonobacteraceae bacterium]|nr:hypothetical protein [Ktedonobacteraceae bacterium]
MEKDASFSQKAYTFPGVSSQKAYTFLIKLRGTQTTDSNHTLSIAPNLVKHDFTADAPNKK